MNHPRKKAAVKKHFSEPYENLEQLRAGLKADESEYTDEEINEIMEAIGEQAKAAGATTVEGQEVKTLTLPDLPSNDEEMAEFNAWKRSQKILQAQSPSELAAAVTKAVPKPSRYKDFDEFRGTVVKSSVANPYNPERPHVIVLHIDLGKIVRLAKIEEALAREFNEFALGHESGMNHGEASTALFYFPKGEKQNGDRVSITEFAAYQRQDIRYKSLYDPKKNISLIMAAQEAAANY